MDDDTMALDDERHCGDNELRACQLVMLRMLRAVDKVCREHEITYWLDGGTLLGAIRHHGFIPWDDDVDIVMPRIDYQRFIKLAPMLLPSDMYVQTDDLDSSYRRYATPCKIRDRYSSIRESWMVDGDQAIGGLFLDIIPLDKFHASGLAFRRDYALKWIYQRLCALQHAKLKPSKRLRVRIGNVAVRARLFMRIEFCLVWYRKMLKAHIVRRNNSLTDDYFVGYGFDSYWIRLFNPKDIFPLQLVAFEGFSFYAPGDPDAILKIFYGDYLRIPSTNDRPSPHSTLIAIDTRNASTSR